MIGSIASTEPTMDLIRWVRSILLVDFARYMNENNSGCFLEKKNMDKFVLTFLADDKSESR